MSLCSWHPESCQLPLPAGQGHSIPFAVFPYLLFSSAVLPLGDLQVHLSPDLACLFRRLDASMMCFLAGFILILLMKKLLNRWYHLKQAERNKLDAIFHICLISSKNSLSSEGQYIKPTIKWINKCSVLPTASSWFIFLLFCLVPYFILWFLPWLWLRVLSSFGKSCTLSLKMFVSNPEVLKLWGTIIKSTHFLWT